MTSTSLESRLGDFRAVRDEVEASVLPLATSVDGRRFSFQASLVGLEVSLGGYVVLEHASGDRFGQLISLDLAERDAGSLNLPSDADSPVAIQADVRVRYALGTGTVLEGAGAPFHDALLRPATPDEVSAWLTRIRSPRAGLQIGELALAPGVPYVLDAGGFDRHTFLCGQSGSGKTYSLGLLLERLLVETTLRIVVLDPNSDFVRLGEVRADADPESAAHYRRASGATEVHTAHAKGEHRLRLRLAELDPAAQAALLRLDPIADREEHAELTELLAEDQPPTIEAFMASERPEARRLAMRIRNLRADTFGVWSRGQGGSVLDAIHSSDARCVVVDLGSLPTRDEQALVAEAVLASLWRHREERRPVLVVIDEAHNVCPAQPDDPLTALATRHAVRIAAEGRKFGLYLLLSTQRPQKVPENVVSQCDNLVLMRLNSAADAAFAQGVFSFVPAALVERSATFRLGEALVAGKISPHAAFVRFGARIAEEGGGDVPSTWASDRSALP